MGTGTSTIRTRKNAANGGLSVSIVDAATGEFQDTSGSDSVAATDKFNYQFVPGNASGTMTIAIMTVTFDASTDTVTKFITSNNQNMTTASTTWFQPVSGHTGSLVTTETFQKVRIRKAGTLKNYGVNVTTNRAQTTTIKIRKNGANGNGSISVTGGGATGWYEDTSNTDSISAGDDLNWSTLTGTGTDTLRIQTYTCEFVNTSSEGEIVVSVCAGLAVTDANTTFTPVSGHLASVSDANSKQDVRVAYDLSNLTCTVSQNDVSSASTVTLRKNGADTTLIVSITGNGTGEFEDTTHTVTMATTDEINHEITVPSVSGAHTVTITAISMVAKSGTNYTTTIATETVSVSESIATMLAATRNPSETTSVSENQTRMLSAFRTIGETTTIGESLVKSKGQPRTLNETVTIGESLTRKLDAIRNPQETTAISESLTRMLAANRTLSDTVTVGGGTVTTVHGFVRTMATETVTINDSLNRMLAATRNPQESTAVSDSLTRQLAATRSLTTETVAVNESLTRMLAATRTLSQSVTVGENLTRQLAATRALAAETVSIGESLTRMLAATRVISQTVAITDQLDFVYTPGGGGPTNYQRTITETTNISESLLRMLAANRALATEVTAISDSLQRSVGNNRTISQSVSIGETLTRKLDAFRTNIENTSVGESLNRILAATRAIATQTVTVGESIVRTLGANRIINETTSIGESLTRKLDAFRTLIETTVVSDLLEFVYTPVGAIHYVVNLVENVSISDSISTVQEYIKIVVGSIAGKIDPESKPFKRKVPGWWRNSFYTRTLKRHKGTSNKDTG